MKQVKLKKIPDNGTFRISKSGVRYILQRKGVSESGQPSDVFKKRDLTHCVVTSERSGKTFIWPLDKLVYPA